MKLKDITVGQEVAVFFYGSADSMRSMRYVSEGGQVRYSFAATKAIVKEVGVHKTVYRGRSYYGSKSTNANYVVVVGENGREETVICTKIVGPWAEYEAEQKAIIKAREEREAAAKKAADTTEADLKAILKKLGISEYELPDLRTGYGHNRPYDSNVIASNKRKLVKVLKLALETN